MNKRPTFTEADKARMNERSRKIEAEFLASPEPKPAEVEAVEAGTPTLPLSRKAKPEAINKRLFDLVRYQRSELLNANLITMDEWCFLIDECPLAQGGGSPSPRRLEDYDRLQKQLAEKDAEIKRLKDALASNEPIP